MSNERLVNLMIKNVDISCESGRIKIDWEWNNRNIESMRIYYKKKEIMTGDGSLFLTEEVLPLPAHKMGKAERLLAGESGIYTFTFAVRMKDDIREKKVVIDDIMLGMPVNIPWKVFMVKGKQVISFKEFRGKVEAKIVWIKIADLEYRLDYEVTAKTELMFSNQTDMDKLEIFTKTPYNKVYHFYKSN